MTLKSTDFESLKNAKRQYRNIKTGEVISKRAYDTIRRGGITNEKAAILERIKNPVLAASRPAKGKKSLLKLPENEQLVIAKARIEDEKRKKEIAKQLRDENAFNKKFNKEVNKKVRVKKIRPQLLKTGSKGARISFNDYDDYLKLFNDGKKATVRVGGKTIPLLFAYGLGMVGVDEREDSGEPKKLAVTVFTMKAFDKPISEKDFYGAMKDELDDRAYFKMSHYFMHLAFSIDYARDRKQRGAKR